MARWTVFVIACALAASAPFWNAEKTVSPNSAPNFRGFPQTFEDFELKQLSLSAREEIFLADFPGKVGRFSDGKREIIMRFVTQATRKLHPAQDCFAAIGYQTKPLPLKIDRQGNRWGCFAATKKAESLRVCERIFTDSGDESWTDVSAWYWSALSESNGEWWAITVAETIEN